MRNFKINNQSETIEIDLFGDIGESWFGDESISMEGVKNILNENQSKNLVLNISSLGGDVNHGFAIHDMLKMHKGQTTAKIVGLTASSGTIVALGADNVEMSENSMFLVHNVWTAVVGNAKDMREMADELDKFDDIAVNIYKNKTGKRKSQILSLMEEEKWINASEAKEFGFIDKVFKPTKAAASIDKEYINNFVSDKIKLPKLENIMAESKDSLIDKVLNFFNKKSVEELEVHIDKETFNGKLDNFLKEQEVNEQELKANLELEIEAKFKEDYEAKEKELQESFNEKENEFEEKYNDLKFKIVGEEEKNPIEVFEALQSELNQMKANRINFNDGSDASVTNLGEQPSEKQKALKHNAKNYNKNKRRF